MSLSFLSQIYSSRRWNEYLCVSIKYYENTFLHKNYLIPVKKCIMYILDQTLNSNFNCNTTLSYNDVTWSVSRYNGLRMTYLVQNALIYITNHMFTPVTPPQKFGANCHSQYIQISNGLLTITLYTVKRVREYYVG